MKLPSWALGCAGFDPAGWWVPVVCTDRGQHPMELLAVIYEHSEGRGRHYGGHTSTIPK